MQHLLVELKNPDEDILLGMLNFNGNQEQYDRFSELNNQLRSVLMSDSHKSSFTHNTFSYNYCAKPLIYRVDASVVPNCSVDISKAYPWALSQIKTIPTFNGYDSWKVFIEGDIQATNHYIIERKDDTEIPTAVRLTFLAQKTTEYRGTELITFTQRYTKWTLYFTIKQYRVPSRVDRDCREIRDCLETIFNDPILAESQKKFIGVCATGIIEKTKNKKYATILVDDGYEASYYHHKYKTAAFAIQRPGVINCQSTNNPLCNLDIRDHLWKLTISSEKDLEDGFYPIKVVIYSIIRLYLLEICEMIEKMGGTVNGFVVDCVYFHLDQTILLPPKFVKTENSTDLFHTLGKLKWDRLDEDSTYPLNDYKDKTSNVLEILNESKKSRIYDIKSECNWRSDNESYLNEAIELVSSLFESGSNHIVIEAEVGGAGKTYLGIKIGEHLMKSKKVHIVVQNNFRIKEIQEETSLDVSTLEKLLNIRVDKGRITKCKTAAKFDIETIDLLLIDEIFYHSIQNQEYIRRMLQNYPNLCVIGMGDHVQSRVNTSTNNVEEDLYWSGIVRSMFDSVILLKENKRLTEIDIPKMLEIKDYLVCNLKSVPKSKLDIPYIQTFADIARVMDRVLDDRGQVVSKFITYTNETAAVLNKMIHERVIAHPLNKDLKIHNIGGLKLWVGLTLRNRLYQNIGKEKLYVNYSYTITGFPTRSRGGKEFTVVEIADSDISHFIPPSNLKNFVYGYACTSLSSQGCTYKDCSIFIFDCFHSYMKNKDIYTSILRTNALDNVSIYNGPKLTIDDLSLPLRIENRIISHQTEDKKKGRFWDQNEYVDREWVENTFERSSCTCPWCGQIYSLTGSDHQTWSIDRFDDRFAHTKINSTIAHRGCNSGMAKDKSLFLHL
jgi:hypothetical protein